MSECPECKEQIDKLNLSVVLRADLSNDYEVVYDSDKDDLIRTLVSTEEPDIRDVLEETYSCPKCECEVAGSFDEASEILLPDRR